MAYVFQKIQDAMDGQKKADIFGQAPMEAGQQQDQGGVPKTSTEGELGAAGGQSGVGAGEQRPADDISAKGKVIQSGIQKAQAPRAFGRIENAINEGQKNLQDEANAYGATSKIQAPSAEDVYRAPGTKELSGKLGSFLNQGSQKVEQFKPKTSANIEGLSALNSPDAVASLLRDEAGPEMTGGEMNLMRSVYNRKPQFQQTLEALKNKGAEFQKQIGMSGQKESDRAQIKADQELAAKQQEIRQGLEARAKGVQGAAASQAAAQNAAINPGAGTKMLNDSRAKIMAQLQERFKNDPEMMNSLQNLRSGDLAPFLNSPDMPGSMATQDQSNEFANIMEALGRGDSLNPYSGNNNYSVDEARLQDNLLNTAIADKGKYNSPFGMDLGQQEKDIQAREQEQANIAQATAQGDYAQNQLSIPGLRKDMADPTEYAQPVEGNKDDFSEIMKQLGFNRG